MFNHQVDIGAILRVRYNSIEDQIAGTQDIRMTGKIAGCSISMGRPQMILVLVIIGTIAGRLIRGIRADGIRTQMIRDTTGELESQMMKDIAGETATRKIAGARNSQMIAG
jgi:hypothetical protein